ncbi:hypothetical protein F504_3202 [Ralstonia pseudosolanacearum FQY_4]|nr:hypothetical protein F504_3202 [Ralstonia pseudosolanacearum FQY_4]
MQAALDANTLRQHAQQKTTLQSREEYLFVSQLEVRHLG